MKIAYCATVQPPFGGLRTFNEGLVHAFIQLCSNRGFEFILITHESFANSFGLPSSTVRTFSGNHFVFENLRLPALLKNEKVDWAIFPHNRIPVTGSGGAKSSVIIHDLLFWRFPDQVPFLTRLTRAFFMSIALRNADRVFSVSEFTARELRDFGYKGPVSVCLEGIADLEPKHETPYSGRKFPTDKPYFLFIGARSFQKNLPALIQAFGKVRDSGHDCRLILAGGKGTQMKEVSEALIQSPFQSDILQPGFVSEEEKQWLLQHAVAFVFPSIYEGFGIPILEAFQSGALVICSDQASLPEVAGDAAILSAPYPDGLALSMIKAFEMGPEMDHLKRLGESRWRKFTWEFSAGKLLETMGLDYQS